VKNDILQQTQRHAPERVQLRGTVAGATACELVADTDEIVVGAAAACDLPVVDPLMPARAFRLRRVKCHAEAAEACRCHWVLEAAPGARVYVNQQLTRRERLRFGDIVESACHRFVFDRTPDDVARNRRLHQNVADLCARLLVDHPAPAGFIKNGPLYGYIGRRRKALSAAGLVAAFLLMLALFVPQKEQLDVIAPPLEVQVAETPILSPDAVRSLQAVKRQAFEPTEPPPPAPELAEKPVTPPPDATTRPRLRDATEVAPPTFAEKRVELAKLEPLPTPAIDRPTEVRVERNTARLESATREPRRAIAASSLATESARLTEFQPEVTEEAPVRAAVAAVAATKPKLRDGVGEPQTWQLPILPPAPIRTEDATVRRQVASLSGSTPPARRLSVSEAVQMAALSDDAAPSARPVSRPTSGPVTRAAVRDVLAALPKPTTDGLKADPSATFDQLAAYRASPVNFESFKGLRVPVVRITETLEQIEAAAPGTVKLDGTISQEEIAVSWKSGRFHIHAPGQPPPEAEPPTYCYVGKSTADGKPCLYIAFTCVDPDVSKLVTGSPILVRDDTIEIFLDTNADRKDYFQFIVNSKGTWWGGYYPRPMIEGTIQTRPEAWDAGAMVKTTITREPGQWACEILIPFDRLGGVPAKGTRWAVNFARNFRGQVADWQLQSWFAVYDKNRNYHHPSLFGIFQW